MSEYDFDQNYPFDKIEVKNLKPLQGGTFLAKLQIEDDPIIIQTPKCKTKHGIHKTSKVTYCDLLLDNDTDFLNNIKKLEERVRGLIFDNSDKWFSDEMSLDDIEYHWNSITRDYKTKKLLRTYVQKNKRNNKSILQIYDENEEEISEETLNSESDIICIFEISGLKFSSQSFYLEAILRQVMVFKKKEIFKKCLIRVGSKKTNTSVENTKPIDDKQIVEVEEITEENEEINDNEEEMSDGGEDDKNKEENIEDANDGGEEEPFVIEKPQNLESTEEIVVNPSIDKTELNNTINTDSTTVNNLVDKEENYETSKTVEFSISEKEEEIDNVKNENTIDINNNLDELEEIDLNIDENEKEAIILKEPNEVYLDIYKAARLKAKQAKADAIKAYLEAKKIKKLYMLDDIDSSSEEDEDVVFLK